MFGSLLQRMLHNNAEEDMIRQEVEGQVDNAETWLAISEQNRRRSAMYDEEALDDEMAKSRRLRDEIRELRLNLARIENAHILLRAQHDGLEQKKATLRETALGFAIDRRAIIYALRMVVDQFPDEKIALIKKFAADLRDAEVKRLQGDKQSQAELLSEIDRAFEDRLRQQN